MVLTYFYLLLLVIWDLFSRFVFITKFPPLFSSQSINLRLIAVAMSSVNVVLIYYLSGILFANRKVALLSAWVLMILPWSIEQGRIGTSPNVSLSFFLLSIILFLKNFRSIRHIIFSLILLIFTLIFFPGIWFFQNIITVIKLESFVDNILYLTSPEFLFFKNIISWWEGVRYFGILFISLMPFILIGLYSLISRRIYFPLLGFSFVLIVSALSPFFPQSKEFYLSLPFISIIVAYGFYHLSISKSNLLKVAMYILILMIIYDQLQFFHFYFYHYPIQIMDGESHLNEMF